MRHHSTIRRRVAAGFTLLEMVIVLGIIAVLLGGSIALIGGIRGGAEIQRVDQDFNSIGSAIKSYRNLAGNYPTQQQGIKALVEKPASTPVPRRWSQSMESMPKDPWNNDYGYKFPGTRNKAEFELVSMGPDGQAGTADDLSSQDPK